MREYYTSDLLKQKISLLKKEEKEEEILILLDFFSKAQDLVEEVIPLHQNGKLSYMALILKMKAREKLLFELMKPFLDFEKKVILFPISLN